MKPELGKLIHPNLHPRRDAVHICIAPAIAQHDAIVPGERVGVVDVVNGVFVASVDADHLVGIVDPFLNQNLAQGDRFWMLLCPHDINGLRHEWSHPILDQVAAIKAIGEFGDRFESEPDDECTAMGCP